MPSRPVRPPSAMMRSPGFGPAPLTRCGDEADAAAEDQGVADVAIVEVDGAVDGGDAHAVAVVADAGDDLGQDARGVERGRWGGKKGGLRGPGVQWSAWATQKTSVLAMGLAPEAGADDIADAAADAPVAAPP
jgi:hypothetical protein